MIISFKDSARCSAGTLLTTNREISPAAFPFARLPNSFALSRFLWVTRLPRASAVNEFRASFTRLALFDAPQSAFRTNEAAALGLDNPPTDPFAFGLPYFFVTDFSTVTDDPTLPQIQRDNVWSFSDSFTVVRGRHTWAVGADWSPFQMNYQQSNLIRGKYTYTGAYTADPLTSTGGDGLADFLLGYPLTTQRTVGSPLANLRQKNFGLFVQHNWHPTSALSVTLGLTV